MIKEENKKTIGISLQELFADIRKNSHSKNWDRDPDCEDDNEDWEDEEYED